jgi:hypothetical protein
MVKVYTNNHKRDFLYGNEVPEKILASEFSHLDDDEKIGYFIFYRKWYYHLSDFMFIDKYNPFYGKWDGYLSESFFSGVLIKYLDDEQYIIGTYIS